jgi:hypothetical protein
MEKYISGKIACKTYGAWWLKQYVHSKRRGSITPWLSPISKKNEILIVIYRVIKSLCAPDDYNTETYQ